MSRARDSRTSSRGSKSDHERGVSAHCFIKESLLSAFQLALPTMIRTCKRAEGGGASWGGNTEQETSPRIDWGSITSEGKKRRRELTKRRGIREMLKSEGAATRKGPQGDERGIFRVVLLAWTPRVGEASVMRSS